MPPTTPDPNDSKYCCYINITRPKIYDGHIVPLKCLVQRSLDPFTPLIDTTVRLSLPFAAQLSGVDNADAESTKSEGTVASTDSDVPLKPTNELDKRVSGLTLYFIGIHEDL